MAKTHSRETLVQNLKGQVLRIPDLEAATSRWPRAVNPHLDTLRCETKSRMDR